MHGGASDEATRVGARLRQVSAQGTEDRRGGGSSRCRQDRGCQSPRARSDGHPPPFPAGPQSRPLGHQPGCESLKAKTRMWIFSPGKSQQVLKLEETGIDQDNLRIPFPLQPREVSGTRPRRSGRSPARPHIPVVHRPSGSELPMSTPFANAGSKRMELNRLPLSFGFASENSKAIFI